MASLVAAATAVKAALNSAAEGTFAQAFTARRQVMNLKDRAVSSLTVSVWPRPLNGDQRAFISRAAVEREVVINIGVQQGLAVGTDPADETKLTELDGLTALVEQIASYFQPGKAGHTALRSAGCPCVAVSVPLLNDPERLHGAREFAGVINLTLRLYEE